MFLTDNQIKPNGLIDGVHRTLIVSQQERTDELNQRLASRQFPDTPLEPSFSPRPLSTKYNLPYKVESTTPILPTIEHNVFQNFNPATRAGPFKTYMRNVDTETILRNQTMAIQKSSQSVYVPSSTSDLYVTEIVSRPSVQPYPRLFQSPVLERDAAKRQEAVRPYLSHIGQDRFFNSTRTQIRQPQ